MRDITIQVSDAKYAGLEKAAAKDKMTVAQKVQEQMDYYTDVVIKSFIEAPADLTKEQQEQLDSILVDTKAAFLETVQFEQAKG